MSTDPDLRIDRLHNDVSVSPSGPLSCRIS